MSKITIISEYFPPDNGAAAERVGAYYQYFQDSHDVFVITATSHHLLDEDRVGKGGLDSRIIRIKYKKKKDSRIFARLFHEIQFSCRVALQVIKGRVNNILIVSTPSPFLALMALLLNKIRNQQYILDVRDLYPNAIAESGVIKQEHFLYRLLDYGMKAAYSNAVGIAYVNYNWNNIFLPWTEKSIYVPNGIDKTISSKAETKRQNLIVYSGNFGRLYDFDFILQLAAQLQDSTNQFLNQAKFLLIGDGVQRNHIISEISRLGLVNVEVVGPFKKEKVNKILLGAKIGIVSLKLDADSLKGAIPNKIYDYLDTGLSIVALLPARIDPVITAMEQVEVFTHLDWDRIIENILSHFKAETKFYASRKNYPFLFRDYHFKKMTLLLERSKK